MRLKIDPGDRYLIDLVRRYIMYILLYSDNMILRTYLYHCRRCSHCTEGCTRWYGMTAHLRSDGFCQPRSFNATRRVYRQMKRKNSI